MPSGTNFLPSPTDSNAVEVPWGKGILGWCAETGETVNLEMAHEVHNDDDMTGILFQFTGNSIISSVNPLV